MELTRVTTATGQQVLTTLAWTAVKSRMGREAWLELEKAEGGTAMVLASTVTGYESVAAKRKVGFC